jgi:hypothetical protein
MLLFNRQAVCSKLGLSRWQSYTIFPTTNTGMIREAEVLHLLNSVRSKNIPPFSHVPVLITAEMLEEMTSVPVSKIKLWTRRKRNPIPHIRFNSHVIRFLAQASNEWLQENSK